MGIDTYTMPTLKCGGHRGGARAVEPVFAEVDDDDFEKVSQYKWNINRSSNPHSTYAFTRTGGQKIHLHRLIMGLGDYKTDKRIINHKDGNGLNNKKENLEICDTLYNSQSFKRHNTNVGMVYYDTSMKRVKRWRAHIVICKKSVQKRFATKEEAEAWLQTIVSDAENITPETMPTE